MLRMDDEARAWRRHGRSDFVEKAGEFEQLRFAGRTDGVCRSNVRSAVDSEKMFNKTLDSPRLLYYDLDRRGAAWQIPPKVDCTLLAKR